jgi:hypothetical protein
MSGQDEGQLKVRLGGLLNDIDPHPAPFDAVIRQGRGIKRRRQAAVAGGLAVIAAGAVLAPVLLHGQASRSAPVAPSPTRPHYSVRVSPPAPDAGTGVIATGSINGRHWQATLSGSGSNVGADFGPGFPLMGSVSGALPTAGQPVMFVSESGNASGFASYVGTVATSVRYLKVTLESGQPLTLVPRSFAGRQYVAMVLPEALEVENAVAYGAHGELAYAIPYNYGGSATFQTWLQPGQQGPAPAGASIGFGSGGRGRWSAIAYVGPWGLCERVREPGGGTDGVCQDIGKASPAGLVWGDMSGGVGAPELGQARPQVAYVLVTRSDGSVVRIRAVHLSGYQYGLLAMIRPAKSGIRSWAAYDASGKRLGSGTGDPLGLR